jgi:hypothetical protein
MKITRSDVSTLRDEAAVAGDFDMVAICDLALSGNRQEYTRGDSRYGDDVSHAWRKCLNAIEFAAGQS